MMLTLVVFIAGFILFRLNEKLSALQRLVDQLYETIERLSRQVGELSRAAAGAEGAPDRAPEPRAAPRTRATVLWDLTRPVDPGSDARVRAELERAGVAVVSSDRAVSAAARRPGPSCCGTRCTSPSPRPRPCG